ncbi:MAG: M15 family metallopeptidase [Patescibacteria group bacterium]
MSPQHLVIARYSAAVLVLAAFGFVSYHLKLIYEENAILAEKLQMVREDQLATAKSLSETLALLDKNLTLTKTEQEKLRGVLTSEQVRVKEQQKQLESISGTVGTLEKLTYTDEELLKKYSKIYFLNEHYIPANLSKISSQYTRDPKSDLQIHSSVLPHLEKLLKANTSPDFDLRVSSSYRSFGTQADLKSNYSVTYGAGSANQFSADQGYSEHQLGTTIDFTTVRTGTDLSVFKDTSDYKWLLANAHQYGFTLSYPENNAYYQFEPWHWRFVGVKLATDLYNQKKHFYDLEQREIDKYLVNIFDK